MSLSPGNIRKLRAEYDALSERVNEDLELFFKEKKEYIIQFCAANDIQLNNIIPLDIDVSRDLLGKLLGYISLIEAGFGRSLGREIVEWKNEFKAKELDADKKLRAEHARDYASISDKLRKTGNLDLKALFTGKDVGDLLTNPDFISDDVLLSKQFSFTEMAVYQFEELKRLIAEDINDEKEIFIPVGHDRHWFYLSRRDSIWSIQDSQPIKDGVYSDRQESIIKHSKEFLTALVGEKNLDELSYVTSGKQENDYDCGTQVVNAYRKAVDEGYIEKTHEEYIDELLSIQVADDFVLAENEEELEQQRPDIELTKKEKQIIKATTSAQASPEKSVLYKQNIIELIEAVVNRGLFANVHNKIDVKQIDSAIADQDSAETDEEFAIRLQEAEFRKVGL